MNAPYRPPPVLPFESARTYPDVWRTTVELTVMGAVELTVKLGKALMPRAMRGLVCGQETKKGAARE